MRWGDNRSLRAEGEDVPKSDGLLGPVRHH